MRIVAKGLKKRGLEVRTFLDGHPTKGDVIVEITGLGIPLPKEFVDFIHEGIRTGEFADALLEGFAQKFNAFLIIEAISQTENDED